MARESSIAPRNSGDAVAVCWDDATLKNAQAIAEYGLTHKLPTVAPLREYVNAGVLVAFGANLSAQRRRAAYYVDRILKGAKPMDLPVERPTLFELSVNLKTAGALGLTLPPALVMRQAEACGLLQGRPAELAEEFRGLLWGDLMVSLLLGVVERPNVRESARRARDAAAAFLQLHP